LEYASFCKQIKVEPTINEDPVAKLINHLKREIKLLKKDIENKDNYITMLIDKDKSNTDRDYYICDSCNEVTNETGGRAKRDSKSRNSNKMIQNFNKTFSRSDLDDIKLNNFSGSNYTMDFDDANVNQLQINKSINRENIKLPPKNKNKV